MNAVKSTLSWLRFQPKKTSSVSEQKGIWIYLIWLSFWMSLYMYEQSAQSSSIAIAMIKFSYILSQTWSHWVPNSFIAKNFWIFAMENVRCANLHVIVWHNIFCKQKIVVMITYSILFITNFFEEWPAKLQANAWHDNQESSK